MKAILVFIDGTICDTRGRHHLIGTPDFYLHERMLEDRAVPGSAEALNKLSNNYEIVYIGARPPSVNAHTKEWLQNNRYPMGDVYLAENQDGRLTLIKEMIRSHDFIAGIGDRWDDNQLHTEIGCLSIMVEEYQGQWERVAKRIDTYHRQSVIAANRIHLQGKIEGLARVCPLLETKYGDQLWVAYLTAVLDMAEATREVRRAEDLASFAEHNLDPNDLRDAAEWDQHLREDDWENNRLYGLQRYELVEATQSRYIHKVTSCYYAELWKKHGRPDIGYQVHCRTDRAWWDRPAWNPEVRFDQPKTIMQGDDYCLFIQTIPNDK